MLKKTVFNFFIFTVAVLFATVCSPSGDEPEQVDLEIVSDVTGITECTNDLGWKIDVNEFTVAFKNLEFTIEGETHAGLLKTFSDFIIPSAMAHPGHLAGGEVTGELTGDFVVDFAADKSVSLGVGTLLENLYEGMNLYFTTATHGPDGEKNDTVIGHTAHITGTATKGDTVIPFDALLDVEDNLEMVGAPFEFKVTKDSDVQIGVKLFTIDPFENDTIFDGIDFSTIDLDGDGNANIRPGDAAHNLMFKDLISHDQWFVVTN